MLKCELETYKLRVKSLQEENKAIKQASVHIVSRTSICTTNVYIHVHTTVTSKVFHKQLPHPPEASKPNTPHSLIFGRFKLQCELNPFVLYFQQAKAEQEEEFISNTLLKKIQALKKEKESLALNYEQEEECLTNDLSRKLNQVGKREREREVHSLKPEAVAAGGEQACIICLADSLLGSAIAAPALNTIPYVAREKEGRKGGRKEKKVRRAFFVVFPFLSHSSLPATVGEA